MSILTGFVKEAADLQEHQRRIAQKLQNQNSLLVYHQMGSGKTLSALNAGSQLHMPIKVVAPASIKDTFYTEKKKFKIHTPVSSYSYNKPPENVSNKDLLVFDEAHRLGRYGTQRSQLADRLHGGKTLYMTGTPIRNDPSELIPLMRGLGVHVPKDPKKFNEEFVGYERKYPGFFNTYFRGIKPSDVPKAKNLEKLKHMLKGKVDYYNPPQAGYPSSHERDIYVDMTPKQEKTYKMALSGQPSLAYKISQGIAPSKAESRQMNAFLTATREISNVPGGFNTSATVEDAPKLMRARDEIVKRLKRDPNYKGVTYSNYLEHGVFPMASILQKSHIPYAIYTGDMSAKEKAKAIRDYNSGRVKQLLISGAGGEGLNLKGTKVMQLLEPHFNDPKLDQVKARAIRFGSHAHLPESERQVEIQNFYATRPPHGFFFKTRKKGTDEYLRMLARQKTDLNKQFLGALQEVGSTSSS